MVLENVLKEYRSVVRLVLNTYNGYTDIHSIAGQLLSLFITYIATVTAILLLTGTIGIVNSGNILTDGQDERKYLEK